MTDALSLDNPIIIVGSGHAGVATAAALRAQGWHGGITLIDEQGCLPYERPPLSKEALLAAAEAGTVTHKPLRKESYFETKGIERIANVRVESISTAGYTIRLDDGRTLGYHRLVIATGARGRQFDVPGATLPGVFALRTAQDAERLNEALVPGSKLIVIGAGYIGMEVAASASKRGCEVQVLEFQDRAMKRVTSAVVSEHFQRLHADHGVQFAFGVAVSEVQGDEKVERIVTNDGQVFDADIVVAGIGVIPNEELAAAAGIECRNGILVDEHCRTSDPAVYAAGDVTRFVAADGSDLRLECLQNATQQAEIVAASIMGKQRKELEVPWFWTVQFDRRLQTAGVMRPDDEIVVRGDSHSEQFTVCYLRDGALAAVDTIGSLTDFRQAKKLILAGAVMDRDLLTNPDNRLDECVASDAFTR